MIHNRNMLTSFLKTDTSPIPVITTLFFESALNKILGFYNEMGDTERHWKGHTWSCSRAAPNGFLLNGVHVIGRLLVGVMESVA